ncbi:MAG: ABC transporter ATP-binding protein [Lactobacillus sp.]|nr:ABC transporter ATP-binding protein [Lactobacillus sp.]
MTIILKVQKLNKVYGKKGDYQTTALKSIDFTLDSKEFVGIMGASGSGKSTLLNIIASLDKPTSGQVLFHNQNITKLNENELADFRAQQIGFIFQNFNLLENLTSRENISLPLMLQKTDSYQISKKVEKVAQQLSIYHLLDKYPTELSGGQKQRVASARALISEPQLILADEPTGALDSKSAQNLLNLLSQINENNNVPLLMVTHDPIAASYCDRVLFIKDGVIFNEASNNSQNKNDFYHKILTILERINS